MDLNIDKGSAEFASLTVDAGAKFSANFDWQPSAPSVKSLKGTLCEINGTLTFSCLRQYGIFSLDVPVTGSGRVEFGGYVKGTWADPCGENQRITSDNSAFAGKFRVSLPNTVDKGESCARGVEISAASALGGALKVILESGTDVTTTLSIPLVTVPAADADALAGKIRGNVTVEGLARRRGLDVTVNPVDNGLACVQLDIVRPGLYLILQ